ncbi:MULTISPECIES: EAL domain-containing protein [Cobetia]|uniref:EAL domain-containing protein n=1 Tax=Cobetia TaxID=204286 RepID=UPI0004694FEC|nr:MULTISPECIES: EAL domain-containing protein [Cobetia]
MSRSPVSDQASREQAHEAFSAFDNETVSDNPRYRFLLIPILLIALILVSGWLTVSQINQIRDNDRQSAAQRLTLWMNAEQRMLGGQLRENAYWEEAVEEMLRKPTPDNAWLDYMYGAEFATNTGIHLIGVVRGNGRVAAWGEHVAASEQWLGEQPEGWRRALSPLLVKSWNTPTVPQITWVRVAGQPWLVGVQGLYADEEALPSRDQQGLLIFGIPMTAAVLSEQAAVLGLNGLEIVSNKLSEPIATERTCVLLPQALVHAGLRNSIRACWKDESRGAELLLSLGAPFGALLLVILLAVIGACCMIWRDHIRRKISRGKEVQCAVQLDLHHQFNEQFLTVPYETHNQEHAKAILSQYLRRVREMAGAEVIIYRREVGNPSAGYLILQSRDEREWLSEASLKRDPLWRLPVGPIRINSSEPQSAGVENRALQLCQRLGASQLLGYSISPHPGRSELLLIVSRGNALDEVALMPVLDRTLNTLIIRGLEQERILLQHQLLQERETDADTGLLSREGILRLIKMRIDQLGSVSPMDGFVLMALRIGGLQELYEHEGASLGNHQLELVQKRIAPLLGNAGHVARLETDRLLIMVQRRLLEATCGGISGWLDSLLGAVRHKVTLDNEVIYLQASLGISRYPEDGQQMDALVYRSERALHDTLQLKREWHFFDEAAEREVRRLKQLEAEFIVGLREGQLRLHLQPIVDGRDGTLMLSEALVRWQHPDHGLMGSADFMAIVESARLDVALGRWVLKESIATLIRVHEAGHELNLSVNVTVRHMMDKRFLSDLDGLFRYPGLCQQLTLELVESQLPDDIQTLAILFQKIRAHGVALALDDFGTGYSSLSQLQRLPFDKLKIDRQFVTGLGEGSSQGQAMIDAMLGLAEAFQLSVVAEGIETPKERAALIAHGCTLHQGYLYSRPLPAQELIDHLMAGDHWLPADLQGIDNS